MERLGGRVAPVTRKGSVSVDLQEEALPQRVETALDERQVEEKPRASEEIVIEEISIDGMCGVY